MNTTASIAEAPTLPLVPDFVGYLQDRLLRETGLMVDDWSRCLNRLTEWEEAHLADESPDTEVLAQHRKTTESLIRFGQLMALSTQHPDFPDENLAQTVAATQRALQDKLSLWHGPRLSRQRADDVLATR